MSKYLFLLCCLCISPFVWAQNIEINGEIVVDEANAEGSKIVISKNGIPIKEENLNKKGHFDLKLSIGADYKLSFEKSGYISKIVSINTEIPEEILESNPYFPPMKLTIKLLPKVKGVDLSVFDQPIAILAYNHSTDDLSFDKEYAEKIKARVDKAEQEIRHQLAAQSAAALEEERKFAELLKKGQQSFDRKEWNTAIDSWTLALNLKPDREEVKEKIASARKAEELEEARRRTEQQNEQTYKNLLASADSLFSQKEYLAAKEKYASATKLNAKDNYPASRIKTIDTILTDLARKEAENQKQLAAAEAAYQKAISTADQAYAAREYEKAMASYQQALELKKEEAYPKEKILLAQNALANLQKQQAAEAEQQRLEQERRNNLKNKYTGLIAEADQAWKEENYSLAKLRYTEANALGLGEEYPKKQLQEIENIINSSKYKAKLSEYNKNKTLAEKNLGEKNYAAAKVYYQKALSILNIDQASIHQKITEIDLAIEAVRLEELEKAYQTNITKADKAYEDKAYAIAKFYYQKALEIKTTDQYATERLKEVEKNIGTRQRKEAEL